MFRTRPLSAAALGLSCALAALPAAADDHRVGLLLPFTGQYAWVGANVQPVARMVADEVNAAGGIGDGAITFRLGDTEGVLDAGATAAQKLINADGVVGIIGPTSLSFVAARQLLIDNGVPMVTPTAGTTALDRGCPGVCFRTVPSDSLGGRAIARAATDGALLGRDQGFSRPVLMVAQSPAMVSFETPITEGFADYGAPLLETVRFAPGKPSYRSEVMTARAAAPDLIVLVAAPEDSVRVMTNAFQAGYQGGWFVTQDQTNDDYIALAGAALVEGVYGLEEVASVESAERNRAFEDRYRAYAGADVEIFGTNTFDAMNVLALAMLHAQLTGGEVTRATVRASIPVVANPDEGDLAVTDYTAGKAALEAGRGIDYQGLVGPVDFDAYGNIRAPFGVRRVAGGAWTDVAILSARALQ